MTLELDLEAGTLTVRRQKGDAVYFNNGNAIRGNRGEYNLLHRIAWKLNGFGERRDVVVRRMIEDGHQTSPHQYYIRSRCSGSPTPHIAIYNPDFARFGAHEPFNNNGIVTLRLIPYPIQEDTDDE